MEKRVARLWLPPDVIPFLVQRIPIIPILCLGPILFLKTVQPLPWAFGLGGTSWDIKIKSFGLWAEMGPCLILDFSRYQDFSCLAWISTFWYLIPKCIPIREDKLLRLPIRHKMQKCRLLERSFLEKQNDEKKLDFYL